MIDLEAEVAAACARIAHYDGFRWLLWRGVLFDEDPGLLGRVVNTATSVKVRRAIDGAVVTHCVLHRQRLEDEAWVLDMLAWWYQHVQRSHGYIAYDRIPREIHEIHDPMAYVTALDSYVSMQNDLETGPG